MIHPERNVVAKITAYAKTVLVHVASARTQTRVAQNLRNAIAKIIVVVKNQTANLKIARAKKRRNAAVIVIARRIHA